MVSSPTVYLTDLCLSPSERHRILRPGELLDHTGKSTGCESDETERVF